ncbi:MAG: hypothetical protein M5U25_01200 [Planctomycetota bacterium]|nr:hypothetical protein [Planctomycetota bacterium]
MQILQGALENHGRRSQGPAGLPQVRRVAAAVAAAAGLRNSYHAAMLPLAAKTTEAVTEGTSIAEILGYGMLAFLLVLTVVSTRIVMECVRKQYVSPLVMAPVLYGTSIGPFLMILLTLGGVIPESDGVFYAILACPVLWILALVVYTVVSGPKKRAEDQVEDERREALYSELDVPVGKAAVKPRPPAAEEFTVDDVVEAEPEPTPAARLRCPRPTVTTAPAAPASRRSSACRWSRSNRRPKRARARARCPATRSCPTKWSRSAAWPATRR